MSTKAATRDITDDLLDRPKGTVLRHREPDGVHSVWITMPDPITDVRLMCVWHPQSGIGGSAPVGHSHTTADLRRHRMRSDEWEVIGSVAGTPASWSGDDHLYRAYKQGLRTGSPSDPGQSWGDVDGDR